MNMRQPSSFDNNLDNNYEQPVSSATFYMPTKPLFLFKRADQAFADGLTRTLPPDWNVFVSMAAVIFAVLMGSSFFLPQLVLVVNLNQHGQTTQATVSGHHINYGGKSPKYYVQFSYNVSERTYTVEQDVYINTYNTLTTGTHVTIRYLQDDPTQARLSGPNADEQSTSLYFFMVFGTWAVAIIVTYFLVTHMLRNRQMAADGQLVEGVVVGASLARAKSSYVLKMKYTFTSPISGQNMTRRESTNRSDLKGTSGPAPGTPIKVLYLNDKTFRVL